MRALFILMVFAFSAPFHFANAQEEPGDAEYVVEQFITPEVFEVGMSAMAEIMAQSIELEFVKQDTEVSAPVLTWLGREMGVQMARIMAQKVNADYVAAYENVLSADGLSGLRAFLETPAGREFAAKQGVLAREGAAIGEKYADEIAGEAVAAIVEDIQAGKFSEDTTSLVRAELKELFDN